MFHPRRSHLFLFLCLVGLFLLIRISSLSPVAPAWGSARSNLKKLAHDSPPTTDQASSRQKQVPLKDISRKSLRTRLSYHFPYTPATRTTFPKYIWQTWKYAPSSSNFIEEYRTLEAAWTLQHPGYAHQVVTDDAAIHILRHLYSAVPDVIAAYEALPLAVLKADFFRYLILLARGGIYADIDTQSLQKSEDWVPPNVPRDSYGLVIGIEADPDRQDWADWYSRRIQFCQWTIQAKPGHPVLREIVARITEKTLRRQREGTLDGDDVHGVVDFTGPAVWTDTVFDFFNDPTYFDMSHSKENVTFKQFTGMQRAKRVGDVVVLPITCFSPGIETMGAGGDDDPMAMVKHFFVGIWKPESERHIGEHEEE